jgi:Major intrinsic protein
MRSATWLRRLLAARRACTWYGWPSAGFFGGPPMSFVTTVPREGAVLAAFLAELSMSALLMLTMLASISSRRFAAYTGLLAGFLIFAFISIEAPLSGTGINPARSLASAVLAHVWSSFFGFIWWHTYSACSWPQDFLLYCARRPRVAARSCIIHPLNAAFIAAFNQFSRAGAKFAMPWITRRRRPRFLNAFRKPSKMTGQLPRGV